MGAKHYVTMRLSNAVKRYECESGSAGIPNYDDILPFEKMREKCRESGKIKVGIMGGVRELSKLNLVDAEKRKWKWRHVDNKGRWDPGNWLDGARWLEIVESKRGFGTSVTGD